MSNYAWKYAILLEPTYCGWIYFSQIYCAYENFFNHLKFEYPVMIWIFICAMIKKTYMQLLTLQNQFFVDFWCENRGYGGCWLTHFEWIDHLCITIFSTMPPFFIQVNRFNPFVMMGEFFDENNHTGYWVLIRILFPKKLRIVSFFAHIVKASSYTLVGIKWHTHSNFFYELSRHQWDFTKSALSFVKFPSQLKSHPTSICSFFNFIIIDISSWISSFDRL